jgi:hypothetical protein
MFNLMGMEMSYEDASNFCRINNIVLFKLSTAELALLSVAIRKSITDNNLSLKIQFWVI